MEIEMDSYLMLPQGGMSRTNEAQPFPSFASLTYQALPLQDRYRHHPPLFHGNSWLHDGNRLSVLPTYQAIAEEYAVPLRLQVQEDLKVLLVEVRQNKQRQTGSQKSITSILHRISEIPNLIA